MLEVAKRRLAGRSASFRNADAQTADLGRASFDAVFSRFGVMFFDDPIAAFSNIRAALKRDGRMSFVCWRSRPENPVLVAPFETALPLLPPQPPADPAAPGPFAFADADRLRGILTEAGFTQVTLTPFDHPVGGGGVEAQLELALNIGPLGVVLRENPDYKAKVADAVRDMLKQYETPEGVLLPAAVWIVQAKAS
jgi:SAM-dependent methyltransferase